MQFPCPNSQTFLKLKCYFKNPALSVWLQRGWMDGFCKLTRWVMWLRLGFLSFLDICLWNPPIISKVSTRILSHKYWRTGSKRAIAISFIVLQDVYNQPGIGFKKFQKSQGLLIWHWACYSTCWVLGTRETAQWTKCLSSRLENLASRPQTKCGSKYL